MSDIDELERRLSDQLHGLSRLAPDGDGWDGIHHHIDRRHRSRTRLRVAGVTVALVATVAALVPLAGRGDRPAQVASSPERFPRLVLDMPGYDLVHARSDEDPGPGPDTGRLLVYGDAGPGVLGTGAVVFARLVPAGAPYGIGGIGDIGTELVDVADREGRLVKSISATTSLGWYRDDGSIVHLVGSGLADDALVDTGRAIETALASGSAPPDQVGAGRSGNGKSGDGLVLRRANRAETGASRHGEVDYEGPENNHAGLRLTSGGSFRLDDLILDRLASAGEWMATTVGGQPAVLSTYAEMPDGGQPGSGQPGTGQPGAGQPARSLMWAVRPGVVAELTAQGLSSEEIEEAAASIREVDEDEWAALVSRLGTRAPSASAPTPSPRPRPKASAPTPDQEATAIASPYPAFLAEVCGLSARWLRAGEVGDDALRTTAVADLHLLVDKGRATGLGKDSDVILIADRMVAAADTGDAAALRSERGACR